jgi:hypothetical protein
MTIEVRQMVIKSTVGDDHGTPQPQPGLEPSPQLERLREEILAECQALFELRLRDLAER